MLKIGNHVLTVGISRSQQAPANVKRNAVYSQRYTHSQSRRARSCTNRKPGLRLIDTCQTIPIRLTAWLDLSSSIEFSSMLILGVGSVRGRSNFQTGNRCP